MPLDLGKWLTGSTKPRPVHAWRELHFPAELTPETVLSVLRQLATDKFVPTIAFEVESSGGQLVHRFGVAPEAVARVEQLLAALIPDSAVTTAVRRAEVTAAWRIALDNKSRALDASRPEQVTRALLAALAAVYAKETVVVQWLLGPAFPPRHVGRTAAASLGEEVWLNFVYGRGKHDLEPEERRALQEKRGDHLFASIGRIAISGASDSRTRALAVGLEAALRVAETPGVRLKLVKEPSRRFNEVVVPGRWPLSLNVGEILGLLAWPLGADPLPGIERDRSRWLRPDPRITRTSRVLGEATAPGERSKLGLSVDDARHHLHVIGPTGTGKSTLLANLITQDIAAGRAVVALDPKGDLINDVLERVVPERAVDVVVLDPAEAGYAVGINPLLGATTDSNRTPELVADQVLAVFHGLYEGNWGPRMQDILHASLLTLAIRGDASLCLLPALLTSSTLRRRLVAGLDDPIALEPFWAWFEAISDAERQQAIAPVLNKLRPFLLRKNVRAIVGQLQPRFRVEEVFSERKVLLVSLAKGLVGPEASALLGSLVVAEVWQAVLGRVRVAAERRHPVVIYADEFQDYVHLPTNMGDALAQARGLGVGLVLAHQHLSQLPSNLRAAVLANARSRVCFQLAGDDAQTMARFSGGALEPSDFQRLGRFEAYAQLVAGGQVSDYASMRTLSLSPSISDAETLRHLSRIRYGRPVAEVEAEVRWLVQGDENHEEAVGRRRRSEP
jgi:hypothetical protein